MANKINIFKEKLSIDLPTFVSTRALICANSGGGKSYAVRKLLEESHGKVMSIILDIEGEFKTLREKYDFLLIGNEGADVQIDMRAAKLLPKKLLELNVSSIIDISDMKRSERILYVKRFLDALMECPRRLWKPCLVIIDETHILAGQQEKQPSVSSVIDLMTRGRKRGFCGVLCTQRISKLHKDAVAECNNIMIGRTGLDIDMKRASEILGFTSKQDMLSLRDLDAGEFYVFGTAISRSVQKAKVSSVKTTHPKVGMDFKQRLVPPTPKIKGMLSELNDLPQEAEAELKTVADLKRKIRQLEFENKRSKPQPKIDENLIEKARQQGYNQGLAESKKVQNELSRHVKSLQNGMKKIASTVSAFEDVKEPEKRQSYNWGKHKFERLEKKPETIIHQQPAINGDASGLGICARKIYSFLYSNQDRAFSKVQLGMITGYSHKSGGFNNALSSLNSNGLITKQGTLIGIGRIDIDLVVDDNQKLSVSYWFSKLGKCPAAIFKVLLDNPYKLYSKEELADITGYSANSGGFNNSLSKLNTLEIIIKEGTFIKLNPEILELEQES